MTTPHPRGVGNPPDAPPGAQTKPVTNEWFVKITHHEISTLPHDALLLLAQMRKRSYRDTNYNRHGYADLQAWCGWSQDPVRGESLDRRTGRAIAALVTAGVVLRKKDYIVDLGLSLPKYKVVEADPATCGPWEKLPLTTLEKILQVAQETSYSAAVLLHHWLAWRMLCGKNQSTQAPLKAAAALLSSVSPCSPERVGAVRRCLNDHGLLFMVQPSGRPATVSTSPLTLSIAEDRTTDPTDQGAEIGPITSSAEPVSTPSAPPPISSGDHPGSRPPS
ncbi:hypothetical protein [Luteococcus sp.]|uniref:hypothetical protein n=1 Tax=Luteococcus sp. TaxID=1969402 RepID=UPI0037366679